ncbi:MAG: hypothetical protein WCR54_08255 [Clostridia bacterium]
MKFIDIQNIIIGKLKYRGNENSEMALVKNAINQAYVAFAARDCIMNEQDYSECDVALLLPVDFLVYHSLYITAIDDSLTETTFKIPRHYLEIKSNELLIRDDVINKNSVKSVRLLYGSKPIDLVNDDDTPLINPNFHVGLVYYALFLITDDKNYYDLYISIFNSIPIDNYVADYTNVIDVL